MLQLFMRSRKHEDVVISGSMLLIPIFMKIGQLMSIMLIFVIHSEMDRRMQIVNRIKNDHISFF